MEECNYWYCGHFIFFLSGLPTVGSHMVPGLVIVRIFLIGFIIYAGSFPVEPFPIFTNRADLDTKSAGGDITF